MENQAYAQPSLEIARRHVKTLIETFQAATSLPPTFIGTLARGEPKFVRIYETIGFGFRSYDAVNSRLSAVWPEGTPWPEGIPRQAPAQIEPEVLTDLATRLARIASKATAKNQEAENG